MDTKITLNSVTAVQTAQVKSGREDVASIRKAGIPRDSYQLITRITSSRKLSVAEKSSLIESISLLDTRVPDGLRKLLLNDIAAASSFIERVEIPPKPAAQTNISVEQAVQTYKEAAARQVDQPKQPSQADIVRQRVERVVQQATNTPLKDIVQQPAAPHVPQVANAPAPHVSVPVAANEVSPQPPVRDVPNDIPAPTNERQDAPVLAIPGSSSGNEAAAVTLPGEGAQVAAPLPGSGEGAEVILPGSGENAPEAALPGSGAPVEELAPPPPADTVAVQSETSPVPGESSSEDIVLPGQQVNVEVSGVDDAEPLEDFRPQHVRYV